MPPASAIPSAAGRVGYLGCGSLWYNLRMATNHRKVVKVYGRYIVEDPAICHGTMTFKGTRIFVSDVLEQVAKGLSWETISDEWGGKITRPMIAEAVRLAHEALRDHGIKPAI